MREILVIKICMGIIFLIISSFIFPNRDWKGNAMKRIEKYRKGKFSITLIDQQGQPIHNNTFRVQLKCHAFQFGTAVRAKNLTDSSYNGSMYRKILKKNFNSVVLENDLKPNKWSDSTRHKMTYEAADWIKSNGFSLKGHYLLWGILDKNYSQTPSRQGYFSFLDSIVRVIDTRVNRWEDITTWDAINHPNGWNFNVPTLKDSLGYQVYRDILNHLDQKFLEKEFIINETAILPSRYNSRMARKKYALLLDHLESHQIPFDGIGFMSHFNPKSETKPEELIKLFDFYSKYDKPLHITEYDYRIGKKGKKVVLTTADLMRQKQYTEDFLLAAFSHPAIESIFLWGFWERAHWFPGAALYDKKWNTKPNGMVYDSLVNKVWTTDVMLTSNEDGHINFRGYFGTYSIFDSKGNLISSDVKFDRPNMEIVVTSI